MKPIPGVHNVYNACAAACVGRIMGLTNEEICEGISHAKTIAGRTNLITVGELLVIDDCYNANPVSMKAAIDLLATAPDGRWLFSVICLSLERMRGPCIVKSDSMRPRGGIDLILCVGGLSSEMYEGAAEKGGEARHFEIREALEAVLQDLLHRVILSL